LQNGNITTRIYGLTGCLDPRRAQQQTQQVQLQRVNAAGAPASSRGNNLTIRNAVISGNMDVRDSWRRDLRRERQRHDARRHGHVAAPVAH
jgi:hypothetical protein